MLETVRFLHQIRIYCYGILFTVLCRGVDALRIGTYFSSEVKLLRGDVEVEVGAEGEVEPADPRFTDLPHIIM